MPETEFFWHDKKNKKRHSQCKTCYKKKRKLNYPNYYEKHREEYILRAKIRNLRVRQEVHNYILTYLQSHPCTICGEDDVVVLDFHHLNDDKKFSIAKANSYGYSLNRIKNEISKCSVVCSNCHRRITAKNNGSYRYKP